MKDCRLPSGAMDNRKMSVEMRLLLLLLARCWTAAQQTSLYSARWRWLVSQRSQSNLLLKRWRQAVHALPRGDHVSPTTPSFANFFTHVDCNDSMLLTFDKTGGIMGSSRQPWFDF